MRGKLQPLADIKCWLITHWLISESFVVTWEK